MPAQTHSRVRNGFHILANSRGRLTNLNGPPCNTAAQCEKAYCCGPAIQPTSSKPRGCRRGLCSFTPNRGRKRALALGGVGSRSAATKRAISRRVENRNKMASGYVPSATRPRNATEWPTKNATCKTPCPCCLITMTKNHPRNACLGSCARKSSSSSTPPIPLPPPPGTNITLTLGIDGNNSTAPPSASGTGAGFVGANLDLGYGIITPLPAPSQGTNVLGQTNNPDNSICYQYDNDTGDNVFIIQAFKPGTTSSNIVPFTSITLTNSITGQSIQYTYGDAQSNPGALFSTTPDPLTLTGQGEIGWVSGNNDPNFQWWIDAYSNAINYPSVPSIYITVNPLI